MHHRSADFSALFQDVQSKLQQVFQTRNEILLLSCSGSGAMEAAITNLLSAGDRAIIAVAGKFGERWAELAEAFGVRTEIARVPYGESVSAEQIARALETAPDASAVFVQATETSTGAMMDLGKISEVLGPRQNTALVVDAITGLGTTPIQTDAWSLDIVVGGSQKAFMVPPGVAMLSVSEKAWRMIARCRRPRYYFDLLPERSGQKEGHSRFTPSIAVIQGLQVALDYLLDEGTDGLIGNAALLAGATRAAVLQWGMSIFPQRPSNALTVFAPGSGIDPDRVTATLRDRFGVVISGGQGSLKGRIIRIGHLGYSDFLDTLGMIGCLELVLKQAGASIQIGSGPKAALEFHQSFDKR
jgi:aspartate aminotransferase-like enzyme